MTNLDFAPGWMSCHIWSHNSLIRTGDLTMFLWFAAQKMISQKLKPMQDTLISLYSFDIFGTHPYQAPTLPFSFLECSQSLRRKLCISPLVLLSCSLWCLTHAHVQHSIRFVHHFHRVLAVFFSMRISFSFRYILRGTEMCDFMERKNCWRLNI